MQRKELFTKTDKQTEQYLPSSTVSACLKLILQQAAIRYHYTETVTTIIRIQNEKMTPSHLKITSQHPTWRAAYIKLRCSTSHTAHTGQRIHMNQLILDTHPSKWCADGRPTVSYQTNRWNMQFVSGWKRVTLSDILAVHRVRSSENLCVCVCDSSGVPRNFFRGRGVNKFSWRQRTERTGIWGRYPPSQGFWRQL